MYEIGQIQNYNRQNLPPLYQMKIVDCLGAGSFGKVYKIQVDSHHYALKKIPLQFDCEDDSEDMMELKNEVDLLSSLTYHPNIVRYYSSFRKNDFFFITMEYAGSQCLQDLPLPINNEKQIVNMIIQLAMGLKHIKNNHIIHRDIKPNNILISDKGLLKIADFGISKRLQNSHQAKTCLGTPYYVAPQIIEERQYDYAVDIWSLGVVLYELIHGYLPFMAHNMPQLRSKICFQRPQIRMDLHSDIKLVLRACLAKDPAQRIEVNQIFNIPLIRDQLIKQTYQHSLS